ncbi:30S ribosomal protein S8e [Candidatus Woesearchaeota archaeon]|nr:30S ribosomal protein S8e [Candidatus Woesearchaeota archaeon]
MVVIQRATKERTATGGRKKEHRGKKLYERGNHATMTRVGALAIEDVRVKGGNRKVHTLTSDVANLFDPKTKKYVKAAIKIVTGNPANRHFVRRNILTKGSLIETDKGKARVTNRPGQEGQINAILV